VRILYLHPRSWSGEYAVLVRLRQLGHEVCVLEEDRGQPMARRLEADFENAGDGIATLWYNPRRGGERLLTWLWDRYYRRPFGGRNLYHRAWVIAQATRHFAPDVVICSDGFSYAVPAALVRRAGLMEAPLVVSFIGGDILDCPEADIGKRRTPATTRMIHGVVRHADRLRPVSPMLADVLRRDGADEGRIRVIPSHLVTDVHLLDGVFAERRRVAAAVRGRYGIPAAAPLLVTLSGNQKGKGLQVLAQAWPRIQAALPDARWLLCGPADPWLAHGVWPLLDAAGARGSVIASGRLAGRDVFEHLAAADLHANPSLCEGLNMVTVEAAAVGTPTVCADGAGIVGWLTRFGAGAVVPSGQAGPLADAIIGALANPARLASWSDAGRKMIADFALDRVADQLVDLFEQASGKSPARSPA
jgi:glycosyltransferase involved in cell wall biosynthesis